MCTVTFISKGLDGYVLTSNRDEAPSRSSKSIEKTIKNGIELSFPKDSKAGGTWIATSNDDRMVCLLNGAFNRHSHRPPYRKSRGLMVLDFFEFKSANDFFKQYDFNDIEPFTMVVYDKQKLYEFRWDEKRTHLKGLDVRQHYIWSSCTLYPENIRTLRQIWFHSWLKSGTNLTPESILDFHKNGGIGDPENDFVMNRKDIVKTVSITTIQKKNKSIGMQHHDLLSQKVREVQTVNK